MTRAAIIVDYVSPIREILRYGGGDRRIELRRLIWHLRKLNRTHFYRNLSVDQTVERLLDPAWLTRVKKFDVHEWQTAADLVWKRAVRIFGDVPRPELVLYPGFNRCNGRVYRIDRMPVIVCSPDFPSATGSDLQVLLAHEYVHFARWRLTGKPSERLPIYAYLYEEGLATWLASRILPEFEPARLFMSNLHHRIGMADPKGGYLRWCRLNLRVIAARAGAVLGSRSVGDTGCLFEGLRFEGADTPIRAGYYLGYKILDMLANSAPPKELLVLKPKRKSLSQWIEELTEDRRSF
jgi:hypothetical protein